MRQRHCAPEEADHESIIRNVPAIAWADFAGEVRDLYRPPMRARATYRQVDQVLRELGGLGTVATPADLRSTTVAGWIRLYPARSEVRMASLLRTLSPICRYAVCEGYLRQSPFEFRSVRQWVRGMPMAPEGPRVQLSRTAEQIGAILSLADHEAASGGWKEGRLQALVYLLAFTGMRRGEVLHLRPWDLDLVRRTVAIEARRSHRLKTRSSAATLPLADPARDVLRLWLPRVACDWLFPGVRKRGPWTGGPPGQKAVDQIRQLGERAEVAGVNFLTFRKTVGTLAKAWGAGPLEVQALLRHADRDTQRAYDDEQTETSRPLTGRMKYA